jgi:predicted nuclease of predicted toxin-antitoxin system
VKLLFDENLSPRLCRTLLALYPGSKHIHDLGMGSMEDSGIWNYAKEHGFAIVSKDSDFADRSVLEHEPPKIIWVRIGNCTTGDVEMLLRLRHDAVRTFLQQDPETCLILSTR